MLSKRVSEEALLVAYNIKEVRKNKYKSARHAAEAFGSQASHWSHWETAVAIPYKSTLEKLAKFFHVENDDPVFFMTEPPDWKTKRKDFIRELRRRARKNKDYYRLPVEYYPDADGGKDAHSATGDAALDDGTSEFMEIVVLITNAKKKVKEGYMTQATFNKHMQAIADMIEVSKYGE